MSTVGRYEGMPAVSVIIPTRNRPHLLCEAIQSVLDQTFSDFELLVVDDGSEAPVDAEIETHADPRIRVIRQAHAGRSAARNRGLALATGKYIAFLDDDDTYLPNKLAEQVQFLETNPGESIVSAGAQYVDEGGRELGEYAPWTDGRILTFSDAMYGTRMITSTVLFRRGLLDQMDAWFDPEMDLAEDGDFFLRLLYCAGQATLLPSRVSTYRLRDDDCTGGGPRASEGYRRVIDKAFRLPDLPKDVVNNRDRIYAHLYLICGSRAFAVRDPVHGREQLEAALKLDAVYVEAELPVTLARFAGFRWSDPRRYVEYALENLPASLAPLRARKKEVYQAFLQQQAAPFTTARHEG
ncbi:MAG TPA: glycosyltransferase [Candidatus Hydrogenedentes bacterium]|nr:glycosyltransferase [Candidatus Hydrogenedentota bacterium]HPK00320.1 glycosyltransferase [Candidatus Hydrogenedentota bacterium]